MPGCGLWAVGANAGSILTDQFSLEMTCDASQPQNVFTCNIGPREHIAEQLISLNYLDPASGFIDQDGLFLGWYDEDTFLFRMSLGGPLDNIVIELTGLNFVDGGAHNITGVSTNSALTQCPDEFFACPEVVGPTTAFTADSVTISYSQARNLRADGPVWSFDISTAAAGPTTGVPEPAGLLLLGAGLLGMRLTRKRRVL